MMPAGSINAWKCDKCGRITGAVHIDDGVTPMLLACHATPECDGIAVSAGYPQSLIPAEVINAIDWEWRRATHFELQSWKRKNPELYFHCLKGGLYLVPLTDRGRRLIGRTTG